MISAKEARELSDKKTTDTLLSMVDAKIKELANRGGTSYTTEYIWDDREAQILKKELESLGYEISKYTQTYYTDKIDFLKIEW